MHLGSQFAGRRQYQYPWLFRAVAVFAVWMAAREQSLQNRQGEACGFTSTRLGGDHQVATLQHGGNGPLLHRSGLGVAGRFYGTGQCLGETEGNKGHESSCQSGGESPDGEVAWLESLLLNDPVRYCWAMGCRASGRKPGGNPEYNRAMR